MRRCASSASAIFSEVILLDPNAFLKRGWRFLILLGSMFRSWCISDLFVMVEMTCSRSDFARPSQKKFVFHARFWSGMELRRPLVL